MRQFITKLEANAPFVSKKKGSISDWKRNRESREVDGMKLVDHQEANHMPHDFEKQFGIFQYSQHFSLISFLICVLKKTANQLRIFQKFTHFATIIPTNLFSDLLVVMVGNRFKTLPSRQLR